MRGMRLLALLSVVQALVGVGVARRLIRTARGERIRPDETQVPAGETVSIIVPVLNERVRLAPCLQGAITQPVEVREILVVDGGSTDGTPALVAEFAAEDRRVRLLNASPVPAGWNGKAHGLQVGLEAVAPEVTWILTLDADVRLAPCLVRSLLAQAQRAQIAALSVATLQRLSGTAEGLVHPSLLTTLVYRFGIPGHATDRIDEVQANGQCFLVRRDKLEQAGGFAATRASVCEDVTLARRLVARGERVGFYETDGLISVAMYDDWRDAWRNWTRSLPMRDDYRNGRALLDLTALTLVQALPLPLMLLLLSLHGQGRGRRAVGALPVNGALLAMRVGMLAGMRRAYVARPWTYWCSPLIDLPVVLQLWVSALRRRHHWRGRAIVRGGRGETE